MSKLSATTLMLAAVTLCSPLAQAKVNTDHSKSTNQEARKVPLVKAVDLTAKTITIQLGTEDPMTYTFSSLTRVTVDGKAATIADVKVGMKVETVGTERQVDRIDAVTYTMPTTTSGYMPTKK